MMRPWIALLCFAAACTGPADSADTKPDEDGDGWTTDEGDCDDGDVTVFPTANEVWYDGVDQNCDGNDDDQDGDGVGLGDGDCDDTDVLILPGASELCDGVDNDCNDQIDDDAVGAVDGFLDADGDGYGDGEAPVSGCDDTQADVADNPDDCDDTDAALNPAAAEVCDGLDNNCDGATDDGAAAPSTWHADADSDGFGDPLVALSACEQPEGFVVDSADCDDTDANTQPGAIESCDDVDRNCDGDPTAGATDTLSWTTDADLDGYGDDSTWTEGCVQPEGTVAVGGDCDDADPASSPAGVEQCDDADNDCDGETDEDAADAPSWFTDADGDGVGGLAWGASCTQPEGTAEIDGDCDDGAATTYPGAEERCDEVDNDCNGVVDDGSFGGGTWWTDADGDGFGDLAAPVTWTCEPPAGTVENTEDCDDDDGAVNPDAVETCNAVDDDCDGETDEAGAVGESAWFADADGDAYGDDSTEVYACDAPAGTVAAPGDCDDASDSVNPGANETCNDIDDNCSGDVDDEAGTAARVETTGVTTDVTALMAAGTSADPVIVGDQSTYDLVMSSGTLRLCEGDWYMKIVGASAGTAVTISGAGVDRTSISSGGDVSGTLGSVVASSNTSLTLEDLTITGGLGSSGSKGGAIIASQTTGSTNPSTPNVLLRGVLVTGNSTQYGGGIAINSYGWVALEDSLIIDNTASIAGGGVWMQGAGKLSCEATSLGVAGLLGNTAPTGGGVYFSASTSGILQSTGCDWGADSAGDDNSAYDVSVSSTANRYCYGNASSLSTSIACASGSCTASTDTTCP